MNPAARLPPPEVAANLAPVATPSAQAADTPKGDKVADGAFYSGSMGIEEQSRKLRQIANIRTVEEIDGWEIGMKTRATIPGEMAALMQRRIELQSKR